MTQRIVQAFLPSLAAGAAACYITNDIAAAAVVAAITLGAGILAWGLYRSARRRGGPSKLSGPTACVLWFTGLSGAGKSTLANKLYGHMKSRGFSVERLDGDTVRSIFPNTGFSRQERHDHVMRVGYLASMLEKNGVIVLSSFISPYTQSREAVRAMCGTFVEIYVAASLEQCKTRDVKGLYGRVSRGEITNFTGIDDPYEEPCNPEIIIETDDRPVHESFSVLLREIERVTGIKLTGR